jgi:hypothetical protein
MPNIRRTWIAYIEGKYGLTSDCREELVDPSRLWATQAEIESIKHRMVARENFRVAQPILVYETQAGDRYVIDGHTRARVAWEVGQDKISAIVCSCRHDGVDDEVERMAEVAGGAGRRHISQVPIIDRLGEGTEAWNRRRLELLDKVRQEKNNNRAV